MSKSYPSNLTQDQWELLEPLLPAAKRRGRPRTDLLSILNAIFYVLCEGCTWRGLPGDFPAWQTVYTYFRRWTQIRLWEDINDQIRVWVRISELRESSPSAASLDSQSVKIGGLIETDIGLEGGKLVKGRKRHQLVDTLGLC
jgi:transposase